MKIREMLYLLMSKVKFILESLANMYVLAGLTLYMAEGENTVITTIGTSTYVGNKVNPPFLVFDSYGGLELDEINEWVINNSGRTRTFAFDGIAFISLPSTPNMAIHYALFKNGSVIQEQTISFAKLMGSDGVATLGVDSAVTLNDGDYVEVYCKTDKLDGSFTTTNIQIRFIEIPSLGVPVS